jgi:hypothetical protein
MQVGSFVKSIAIYYQKSRPSLTKSVKCRMMSESVLMLSSVVRPGWRGYWMVGRVNKAIAMDATSSGDRFVVLAISVVYRGCAVPVAWKVLKTEEKQAWQPEWQALLKRFKGL